MKPAKKGDLTGRVLSETLKSGPNNSPQVKHLTRISSPASNGLQTILRLQIMGDQQYFDAAGFPGRTIGLDEPHRVVVKPAPPPAAKKRS